MPRHLVAMFPPDSPRLPSGKSARDSGMESGGKGVVSVIVR